MPGANSEVMKKFTVFIYFNLTLAAVLLVLLLGWKVVIAGERPGMVVLGVSSFLVFYAALSALSLAAVRKGRGSLAAKIWILLFSLVFFYVLLDVVGGLIFMRPEPFRNSPDSRVHHKMLPNKEYVMFNPFDFEVEMTTNNMGFRGRDVGAKDAGAYRIVMLGDSFTMGEGVADGHAFPLIVESILNGAGVGVYDVINLGVESYTPILEYLTLDANIETLKPDLVVMNFDMSDLVGEYVYFQEAAVFDKDGTVIAVDGYPEYNRRRYNTRENLSSFVRSRLFLTGALMTMLQKRTETDIALDNLDVRHAIESENFTMLLHTLEVPQPPETDEMYSYVENSILRTKRLCDAHGSGFILTVYPWGHQVSEDEWIPGRHGFVPEGAALSDRTVKRLREFSAENGIVFFDAFPHFRAHDGDEPLYFDHDMHWTPAGQKLMAESLAGFLEGYISGAENPKQ